MGQLEGALKVFAGTSNPALAKRIAGHLGIPLGAALVDAFPDGETRVRIEENVRGTDVYVVQSTCAPVNQNLMQLLDHDRRHATSLGRARDGRDSVFRLRTPGEEVLRA